MRMTPGRVRGERRVHDRYLLIPSAPDFDSQLTPEILGGAEPCLELGDIVACSEVERVHADLCVSAGQCGGHDYPDHQVSDDDLGRRGQRRP